MKKPNVLSNYLICWLSAGSATELLICIVIRSWDLITWITERFLNPDFLPFDYWPLIWAVILSAWKADPDQVSKGNSDRISATQDPTESVITKLWTSKRLEIIWCEFLWQTELKLIDHIVRAYNSVTFISRCIPSSHPVFLGEAPDPPWPWSK